MELGIDAKAEVADRPTALSNWGAHHVGPAEAAALPRRNDEAQSGYNRTPRYVSRPLSRLASARVRRLARPEVAGKWLFTTASQPMAHVEIDGRVGGSFCFVEQLQPAGHGYTGQYIEIARTAALHSRFPWNHTPMSSPAWQ